MSRPWLLVIRRVAPLVLKGRFHLISVRRRMAFWLRIRVGVFRRRWFAIRLRRRWGLCHVRPLPYANLAVPATPSSGRSPVNLLLTNLIASRMGLEGASQYSAISGSNRSSSMAGSSFPLGK